MLRDLEGSESTLGKDHPDTHTSANNLALLYKALNFDLGLTTSAYILEI